MGSNPSLMALASCRSVNFPWRRISPYFPKLLLPVPGLERSALTSEVTSSAAIVLDGEYHENTCTAIG